MTAKITMIARNTIPGILLVAMAASPAWAEDGRARIGNAGAAPEKVAIRVPQPLRPERAPEDTPANAEIAGDGRIIPLPPRRTMDQNTKSTEAACVFRAGDIRKLVEQAAREENLAPHLAWAVASFERDEGASSGRMVAHPIWPKALTRPHCDPVPAIRAGVKHLARLNLHYAEMLHTLAAYRDGEDRLSEEGGLPASIETLRFIATVMNDAAGGPVLRPIQRGGERRAEARVATAEPGSASQPGSISPAEAPQWASGFVLNLE